MFSNKIGIILPITLLTLIAGGCNSGGKNAKKEADATVTTAPVVPAGGCATTAPTTTAGTTSPTPTPTGSGGGVFMTDCVPSGTTVPGTTTNPGPTDPLTPPASCQTNLWLPTVKNSSGTAGTCHTLITKVDGCDVAKAKQLFVDKGVSAANVDTEFNKSLNAGFTLFQCGTGTATPYVNFIKKTAGLIEENCACIRGTGPNAECTYTLCPTPPPK